MIAKIKYEKWEKAIKNKKKLPDIKGQLRKVENIRRHEIIKELLSKFEFPPETKNLLKPFEDKQKSLQWFFIHMALFIHWKELAPRKVEFLKHFCSHL